MQRPLIVYHSPCRDGFAAAWTARRFFKGECDLYPAQHGGAVPLVGDVKGRHVFCLDFSYHREAMIYLARCADRLTVLDHHKTAEEDLTGLSDVYPHAEIIFDQSHSGARLAWDYFFPALAAPWFINYVEDRDLGTWRLPHSREFSAFMGSYQPWTWEILDGWERQDVSAAVYDEIVAQGRGILRYQDSLVAEAVASAKEVTWDGHRVLVTNATMLISEIAGRLAEGRPFGATYYFRPDGVQVWSLRSTKEGVDVSEIAKKRGGGGHRHAAGFQGGGAS